MFFCPRRNKNVKIKGMPENHCVGCPKNIEKQCMVSEIPVKYVDCYTGEELLTVHKGGDKTKR